jgi:hypothetical protein
MDEEDLRKGLRKRPSIEDVLAHETRKEMLRSIEAESKYGEDWDTILYAADYLPLSLTKCRKTVGELTFLVEMKSRLVNRDFDETKRSQSRKGGEKKIKKKKHIFYDIVFRKGSEATGYGALIQLSLVDGKDPYQSGGYVLMTKVQRSDSGSEAVAFECARFSNYAKEAKPLIDEIGNLYRKI